MELILEIANINRFENSHKLCSYAGLVPSVKQSGSTLRFFVGCGKNKKLCKKKSKQKAICAVARKMCCIAYAILRKQEGFMIL